MPDEALLTHCAALREDPEFSRWGADDYIPLSAVAVPPGLPWQVVISQVDDAPPPEEAAAAARRAIAAPGGQLTAIIGPAFSGQTSAMRRLAYELAAEPDRHAPIFVDLCRYAAQPAGGRRLIRTIAEAAGAYAPGLSPAVEDLLARAAGPLAAARLVIILDGLDGVQRQLRAALSRELRDILADRRLAEQRIILSCRREALPAEVAPLAQTLLLQHLSDREVLSYLRARSRTPAQANTRFGQILNAQLLDLAALPPLLADILRRLDDRRGDTLTRNQLLQDSLDQQLRDLPAHFQRGDAARQSLVGLAWEMSWTPDETLDLNRSFAALADARRERSYSLEDLYDQLCAVGVLQDVDQQRAAFQRPGQRAYCAALALAQRDDLGDALADLLPQCAVVERASRWEPVLISLAGMLDSPAPLRTIAQAARLSHNGLYMVLLARCLQALPRGMFEGLAPRDRGTLLDACAAWADPAREPSPARRAQIAQSLGSLPDVASVRALLRLACERIRPAISRRLDFEYTSVRLSAALALRNLMLFRPTTHPAGGAIWAGADPQTIAILRSWVAAGDGDRATLLQHIQSPDTPVEARMLAVVALADMAADGPHIAQLLRIIVAPPPGRPDDSEALARTAADALTLCDHQRVAALLGYILRRPPRLGDEAAGQLIYLAGRARAHNPASLSWLVGRLAGPAEPQIQARALRSLAWIVASQPGVTLGDQPLAPALLSAARQIGRGQIDTLALPAPLATLSLAGCDPSDPGLIYLRRTALECLRWIPGDAGFAELLAEAEPWPIDLRRALSRSAAIREGI